MGPALWWRQHDPRHLSQRPPLAHAPDVAASAAAVAAVGKAGGGRGRACLRVLADLRSFDRLRDLGILVNHFQS